MERDLVAGYGEFLEALKHEFVKRSSGGTGC